MECLVGNNGRDQGIAADRSCSRVPVVRCSMVIPVLLGWRGRRPLPLSADSSVPVSGCVPSVPADQAMPGDARGRMHATPLDAVLQRSARLPGRASAGSRDSRVRSASRPGSAVAGLVTGRRLSVRFASPGMSRRAMNGLLRAANSVPPLEFLEPAASEMKRIGLETGQRCAWIGNETVPIRYPGSKQSEPAQRKNVR